MVELVELDKMAACKDEEVEHNQKQLQDPYQKLEQDFKYYIKQGFI